MNSKIVIVGGGLSGTLCAMSLLQFSEDSEIILLEKNPEKLGRGVAYHHDFTHQPLNVVASGMSLYIDKPLHFVDWLNENHFRYNHLIAEVRPDLFVPRKIYGDYVIENLELLHHRFKGRLQIRIDEAISMNKVEKHHEIKLESGVTIHADHVILALGNFPPADLFEEKDEMNADPRYFSIPWKDAIYSNIIGNENIMLVGTGLTAIDVVLGLSMRRFSGKVKLISRRGKLPLPHDLSAKPMQLEYPGHMHPRDLWFWVKGLINQNKNIPWTAVIDGLRTLTQKIWLEWSLDERKYFLKRLRPFWEIARHRIPPSSSKILEALVLSGQIEIGKGLVKKAKALKEGIEIEYQFENEIRKDVFQKLINCTGPESNYRKVKFPIIRDLIEKGKVVSDELGLGIKCTVDGKILNAQGTIESGLWCIGPMRKAILWETTALREIRDQAAAISASIDLER